MRRVRRVGFTMIEIVIVILIIGVLSAIAYPAWKESRRKANFKICYANQKTVAGALVQYNLDTNSNYTADPIDFQFLWSLGYIQGVPEDPGYGFGSETNYKIDVTPGGSGVFCNTHGMITK